MSNLAGRSWNILGALTLVVGCSSSSTPNWGGGADGPTVPHDGGRDTGITPDGGIPDGVTAGEAGAGDGAIGDGQVGDGGVIPDGADGAVNQPPQIVIETPPVGSSAKVGLAIGFKVTDGDDGLGAIVPEVAIDGRVLDLGLAAPTAGDVAYAATASYDLPAPPAADGLAEGAHTLTVRAWDNAAQVGEAAVSFALDRSGPQLIAISPLEGDILGGTVALRVKVKDTAGIDDDSVAAEIKEYGAGNGVSLDLVRTGGTATEAEFALGYDTGNLPKSMIWPQLLWRAKDLLGNESQLAYQVGVDNTPPLPSLTSGTATMYKDVACWGMCGDDVCDTDLDETSYSCAHDCGAPECGDDVCDLNETFASCPRDCTTASCGTGGCEDLLGETAETCPHDCGECGDTICDYPAEDCTNCKEDCGECRTKDCAADGTIPVCSVPFDPLSNEQWARNLNGAGDALAGSRVKVGDDVMVPQAMFLRARVHDRGNLVTGAEIVPKAGIDEARVRLYVLPLRNGQALVEGAGAECLRINHNLNEVGAIELLGDPDNKNVLVVDMQGIPPGGKADFRVGHAPAGVDPPGSCGAWGDAAEPLGDPYLHCGTGLASYAQTPVVLRACPEDPAAAAIFTLAPVGAPGESTCEGIQFDANQLPDGWFCVAVVAFDKVGNMGVSRPLRMCVNKDWVSGTACDTPTTASCVSNPTGTPVDTCGSANPYPDSTQEAG